MSAWVCVCMFEYMPVCKYVYVYVGVSTSSSFISALPPPRRLGVGWRPGSGGAGIQGVISVPISLTI
jgi:hypothetical protein